MTPELESLLKAAAGLAVVSYACIFLVGAPFNRSVQWANGFAKLVGRILLLPLWMANPGLFKKKKGKKKKKKKATTWWGI